MAWLGGLTLDAGLGWTLWAIAVAASFCTSLMTVAFGLGGGIALLALLATIIPPAAVIPIHGVVQLGSNAGRAALMAQNQIRSVFVPFAVGSLIGVAIGGSVVVQLPAGALQISLGLFVLWSVYAKPPAFLKRSGALTGGISSFLTMFIGGTGPFVATFVRSQGGDKLAFVATHAMLMTLQHALKTLAFAILGFAFAPWALLIAAMIGAGFLGTVAGRYVLVRIDEKRFRLILNTILTLLALRLIWAGAISI